MNKIENIISEHINKYPKSKPADTIKLIYQNEFGPAHILSSPEHAVKALEQEYDHISSSDLPLFEDIGNFRSRLNLGAAKAQGLSAQLIFAMLQYTAKESVGNKNGFESKLDTALRLAHVGKLPYSPGELSEFIDKCRVGGFKPVSHSDEYKSAYAPAYRIVDSRFARLVPLILKIDSLVKSSAERVTVALDGKCASGKTTAAELLCSVFSAPCVHADHFFLPFELRTPERLAEAGGNIHYERFKSEVIDKISDSSGFDYGRFDCSVGKVSESIHVPYSKVLIIEGAYSMHKSFGKYYGVSAFFDIDTETQLTRIAERDGLGALDIFKGRWIPMENRYLSEMNITKKADFKIC